MREIRVVCAVAVAACCAAVRVGRATSGRRFEWTTKSAEAKKMLSELQLRIENFQFGPAERRAGEEDRGRRPELRHGRSTTSPRSLPDPAEAEKQYEKSRELAKNASDGERRFIEAMVPRAREPGRGLREVHRAPGGAGQGLSRRAADPGDPRPALQRRQPGREGARWPSRRRRPSGPSRARGGLPGRRRPAEGRLRQGPRRPTRRSRRACPRARCPSPSASASPSATSTRATSTPRCESLRTYLAEYKAGGLDQQFPEVFIWNAMARINLENGRLEEAHEGLREGLRERARQQAARGPEADLARPPAPRQGARRWPAWANTRRPGRRRRPSRR